MKSKARVVMAGLFFVALTLSVVDKQAKPEPLTCHFPAIYNFGDSNSDTGAKSAAFFPAILPRGQTFFHRAVGRDCDGRVVIDFIAKHLGLPYLSAYLDSIGTSFRHGANFAMGGATIRPQKEPMLLYGVPPFSLDVQVVQFINFKSRSSWFYNQATKEQSVRNNLPRPEDFSEALYVLDIGQNDISDGFRSMNNAQQLLKELPDIINQFGTAIQNLYEQGARSFWIHNTGPIGCLAIILHQIHGMDSRSRYLDHYGCVKDENEVAKEFNRQLKSKVADLREKLPLAALTYVDIYSAKYTLITNANRLGFLDKEKLCCGYHENNNHVWCGNKANINGTEIYANSCEDPSVYVSWDGVHYTEAANRWITDHIINGSFSDPPVPITQACYRH